MTAQPENNLSISRQRVLVWIISAGAILLTPFAARFCIENGIGWRCPSLVLFELPCPSCGSTRAMAALARLDFLTALRMNPLVITGTAALALAGLRLLRWNTLGRIGWTGFFAAVVLNWIYLAIFLPR